VLDADGTRIAHSERILDWLDERFAEPPLVARDPRTARAQRALEHWTGETFYYYWLRWAAIAARRSSARVGSDGGHDARGSASSRGSAS
jgi:glutathione S-transferase